MTDKLIRDLGENHLVAHFGALVSASLGPDVLVGPGDDCAVLAFPVGQERVSSPCHEDRLLLLACDMMVEDIHFRRDWATPWQIGWKAMAQNISDIAAMGGSPFAAVSSIAAPGDLTEEEASGIAEGLVAAASRYGASLVGGDLVGSTGPIVVDVAIIGWVARANLLLRRGAVPGDAILVTGRLGASAAGLTAFQRGLPTRETPLVTEVLRAHCEPQPRLAEAQAIAATGLASAMMDLSDGLADDLPRLCRQSGVGARLHVAAIPIAPSCSFVANSLGLDSLRLAISGGEDYELLVTCPPHAVGTLAVEVAKASGSQLTVIGEITDGEVVRILDTEGRDHPLGRGFNHFTIESNK